MNKDEVLQIHRQLARAIVLMRKAGIKIETKNYDLVGIRPHYYHKTKKEHVVACMALVDDLEAQFGRDFDSSM